MEALATAYSQPRNRRPVLVRVRRFNPCRRFVAVDHGQEAMLEPPIMFRRWASTILMSRLARFCLSSSQRTQCEAILGKINPSGGAISVRHFHRNCSDQRHYQEQCLRDRTPPPKSSRSKSRTGPPRRRGNGCERLRVNMGSSPYPIERSSHQQTHLPEVMDTFAVCWPSGCPIRCGCVRGGWS